MFSGYGGTRDEVSRRDISQVDATNRTWGPRGQVVVRGVKRAATSDEINRSTVSLVLPYTDCQQDFPVPVPAGP